MRKTAAIYEAEDLLAAARSKAAASPNDTELAMNVRMYERNLDVVTEMQKPRPIPQEMYDIAKRYTDVAELPNERAYYGGAE